MFKIESYITPMIMGYVDKYVKLKPEDFQLSLWGGDAVLNKLDLRLDVIEKTLHLPVTLKSGHIHELRLHVPWTKLGSESVTITINTIECVLKLFDSASETDDASSTKSSKSQQSIKKSKTRSNRKQANEDLPPGYLQSVINRILNNVHIVINNLILKYVDEDIVLSLNIKSGEIYSVGSNWKKAFVDLSPEELVLRKMIEFHDLTVCLDKRDSSGKIQTYQDPIVYRCSLMGRVHMTYDGISASLPSRIRFNVLCEKVDFSLTDTQLPMFLRLIELVEAIYYGKLETPGGKVEKTEISAVKPKEEPVDMETSIEGSDVASENQDGWATWAWSYVPQILPADGELSPEKKQRERKEPPILSIGFYIPKASITFKLTETIQETPYFGPQKVMFKPLICMQAEGITIEMLVKGLAFFDLQMGLASMWVRGLGECVCGMKDTEVATQDSYFLKCSSQLPPANKAVDFMTGSLFDPASPENCGERRSYIFDTEQHRETYTENYALQRWGAFYLDYLYVMQERIEDFSDTSSRSSGVSSEDQGKSLPPETSIMKFLFGPTRLNASSSMVHRIHKIIYCAGDHDYEPYSKPIPEVVDENRPVPSAGQILAMEAFVSTTSLHLTLVNTIINISAAEHPKCDITVSKVTTPRKSRKGSKTKITTNTTPSSDYSLPAIQVLAERFDMQLTKPMYARKMVKLVSKMSAPSGNLIHHCHSHQYIKVFGLQAGLLYLDSSGKSSTPLFLVQPCSGAYYKRTLLNSVYWASFNLIRAESTYELPNVTLSCTRAQTLLVHHVIKSWMVRKPNPLKLLGSSLLEDVFKPSSASFPRGQPLIEVSVSGVELKQASNDLLTSYAGILGDVKVSAMVLVEQKEKNIILLQGPVNTARCFTKTSFQGAGETPDEVEEDLVNFTCQIPCDPMNPSVPGVVFVSVQGIGCLLDPIIYDWLLYLPRDKEPMKSPDTPSIVIDKAMAQSALPAIPEGSGKSASTVTQPSESRTQSQTLSKSLKPTTTVDRSESSKDVQTSKPWSQKAVDIYNLIRHLQVQLEMKSCVGFVPSKSIQQSSTSDIIFSLRSAFAADRCPQMLVINSPQILVHSAGHKPVSPLQDIPVKLTDSFTHIDRLPWTIEIDNFSVYTLHPKSISHYLVTPLCVASTLAVTNKQDSHAEFTALNLCVHTDMKATQVKCSNAQIVLLYELLSSCSTVVVSLQQAFKSSKKSDPQPMPLVTQPQGTIKPSTLPSSVTEPDTAFETYESSREVTPIRSLELDERHARRGPKLSLWIQWTFPKVTVKMYGKKANDKEVLLCTELEDVTTFIDVQEVYAKVKSKVGTVSVMNYIKSENAHRWVPGPWEGITVCASERITRRFQIATNKLWTSNNTPVVNLFGMNEDASKQHAKDHGFLSITFTRALQRSVQMKYKKFGISSQDMFDSELDEKSKRFVHELCFNMQPCDVVLDIPTITSSLNIFSLPAVKLKTPTHQSKRVDRGSTSTHGTGTDQQSGKPLLKSSSLPLMYISAKNFRLFVPCDRQNKPSSCDQSLMKSTTEFNTEVDTAVNDGCDITVSASTDSADVSVGNVSHTTMDHNMLMLQCIHVSLTSQVDNPLPRLVVQKDFYAKAVQNGLTKQPGGVLEDRQYQFDLRGIALCTGVWHEMIPKKSSNNSEPCEVQNPALEWNLSDLKQKEESIAQLFPIASSFDLKMIAVPALVYQPIVNSAVLKQEMLVCGYSLEVNATSDLDFYISTNQVDLMRDLYNYNLQSIVAMSPKTNSQSSKPTRSNQSEFLSRNDSGIDSELSAKITSDINADNDSDYHLTLTPFDILLTAGRISVVTYSHKRGHSLDKKCSSHSNIDTSANRHATIVRKKSDLDWKRNSSNDEQRSDAASIDSHESFQESSYSSKSSRSYEASCSSQASTLDSLLRTPRRKINEEVVPFLYASFSQPHTVVHCSPDQHKIELSCFNSILKGAKPGHVLHDECKMLPDCSDFNTTWFESRPGKEYHKTGIPPALYTMTIRDFLCSPADISLRIERPIKFNLSLNKLQQIESFLKELLPTPNPHVNEPREKTADEHKAPSHHAPPIVTALSKIQHLDLSTVQLVVAFETLVDSTHAGVYLSYSSFQGDVEFNCSPKVTQSITTNISVKELAIKTLYDKFSRPLIGPFSMEISSSFYWCSHSGPSWLPRTQVAMDMGIVPIHFGQEHVMCADVIQQCFTRYQKGTGDASVKSKSSREQPGSSPSSVSKSPRLTDDLSFESADDLRSGSFQYVMADDCPYLLPDPGEIVFCIDSGEGCSTMSWCYPEPRALTLIVVMPVPFSVNKKTSPNKPQCVLQFWDVQRKTFMDTTKFSLSEFDTSRIVLSDPVQGTGKGHAPTVAETWRIVILADQTVDDSFNRLSLEPPLVSPISLAACVQVNSCFRSQLVPAVQLAVVSSCIELHLETHMQHLGKGMPDKLQPFVLDQSMPMGQEYMTLTLDNLQLLTSCWMSPNSRFSAEVSTGASSQVVEYRHLLKQPLLDPFDVKMSFTAEISPIAQDIEAKVIVEPVTLHVGQGAIHTMNTAAQAWKQMNKPDADRLVMSYYIVCNDTQEIIRISQVDSDENLVLQSREMSAYSWRTHKKKQQLHICVDGMDWKWCEPFSLETEGTLLRVIESKQQRSSFLIKIKKISNVQNQIIISGQLYVSSRLSQHLEIKLMTPKQEKCAVLGSCQTVASYVVDPTDVVGLKIRLLGIKKPWSHDVAIVGEKSKGQRLVKIPVGSKGSYIHAWCTLVKQDVAGTQQTLVLLTPLFVMRSYLPFPLLMNINSPRTNTTYQVSIDGFGVERELVGISGDMDHSISFQASANSESSPPAMLTSGHIEQVKWKEVTNGQSFEDLCYNWEKSVEECNIFQNGFENISQQSTTAMDSHEGSIIPNMDITLDYKQMWPGCNTLLLETAPPYLMTNATGLDIVLCQQGLPNANLKAKQYYVPSLPQEKFQLGIMSDNDLYCSSVIELSHDDQSSRMYLPRVQGRLYKTGHTHCTIFIKNKNRVCFLTVSSRIGPSSFRIITVQEQFVLSMKSDHKVAIQLCTLFSSKNKVQAQTTFVENPHILSTSKMKSKKDPEKADPLPFWCLPPGHSEDVDSHTNWAQETVQYVRFCMLTDKQAVLSYRSTSRKRLFSETEEGLTASSKDLGSSHEISTTTDDSKSASFASNDEHLGMISGADISSPDADDEYEAMWSSIVRLKTSEVPVKSAFCVPLRRGEFCESVPFVLVAQQHGGVSYITMSEDPTPSLHIHNECPFSLNYGQTNLSAGYTDATVQEELELFTDLPIVHGNSSAYYTFPLTTAQFPTLNMQADGGKLHLTLAGQSTRHPWSMGIDVTSQSIMFVHIPAAIDVRVRIKPRGHCRHVHIEPVSRAEVSAKEIRSRIKGHETSVVIETPRSSPEREEVESPRPTRQSPPREVSVSSQVLKEPDQNITAFVIFKNLCISLQDEKTDPTQTSDVLRVTADNVLISHRPFRPLLGADSTQDVDASICVGRLQIDNQLFDRENFDFPVILIKQPESQSPNISETVEWLSSFDDHHIERLVSKSLLRIDCSLHSHQLEGVKIRIKPLLLYLEDKFLYALLRKIEPLIPVKLSNSTSSKKPTVPRQVAIAARTLINPLHLKYLTLDEFSVLLSVHASLKLFIATDHSPLTFGRFNHEDILTTTDQLVRALTMHYASGALYRAGWVVGSLEILGNPTSLVRNIGQGVSDLFRMPYSGLTRGPGAFVSGVSQGMASLVKNISAGTLYSITNFASSVSRNMDRLSLDYDHQERQEESRRQKPERLSQGLKQGLTGLGISILGAVAGLADQPIQRMQDVTVASPVQRAAGVVTGVGKGLMGVVTKPIGGAAELVSQTGQGLLHGSGLSRLPCRIHAEETVDIDSLLNSNLKLVWKMLPSLPNIEFLVAVPGQQMSPQTGHSVRVVLLLTSQLLFVVSCDEDTQQQALAVSEIDCHSPSRSLLEIVKCSHSKEDLLAKARVAEFVDKTSSFYSQQEESSDGQSHMWASQLLPSSGTQEFIVNAQDRELFVAVFKTAKNKASGKGFAI